MEKIIAQVDADLSDLIPEFLARKRNDALTILSGTAGERVDFRMLSELGHKLKGEGGSYGLDPISLYGAEIELGARNHDAETIRRYGKQLLAYLDAVEIEYQ
ncbi:MAG TPA: Hpt domain-containing protein [Candidatus Binataceae bacterium]|nr:Hpt domain-containing protein [Candidatus Binataceae bacterium]